MLVVQVHPSLPRMLDGDRHQLRAGETARPETAMVASSRYNNLKCHHDSGEKLIVNHHLELKWMAQASDLDHRKLEQLHYCWGGWCT